jgi:1,4-dihydroxy-2-naphthoyl-CoA hydrolase
MSEYESIKELEAKVATGYPSSLNPVVIELTGERVRLEATITSAHHAVNGFLHAGALVTLADTACGYGCLADLPNGASGFTTIELKSNHLATIAEGTAAATKTHSGRSTQVWDATLVDDDGRTLALFRCTQMILYPR